MWRWSMRADMKSSLGLATVALVLLGACTPQARRYQADCSSPLKHWRFPAGRGFVVANQITIDRRGVIRWNAQRLTSAKLTALSRLSSELNPPPLLLLNVDPMAPCDTVDQVRAAMDSALICKSDELCGEGPLYSTLPVISENHVFGFQSR